jgi:hypothetical protein
MRRALLLLPILLFLGLTAGASIAAGDCGKGEDQCPAEYGGGCVPAGSVCCPDGSYGEPGSMCCGNSKSCGEGWMCAGPDECITMTSKRACSNRTQYCDVGFECTKDFQCIAVPPGNRAR